MRWLLSRLFEVSKTKWTWRWYVYRCKWFGVKVHWIRPEPDEWHTHPWHGVSFFFGSYEEQTRPYGPWKKKRFINFIGARKKHRTRGNKMTLFIHGPRVNEDWYWGSEKKPWRGPQSEDSTASARP